MWLANQTRPDISNAVRAVVTFVHAPKHKHWKAARGVLGFWRSQVDTVWRSWEIGARLDEDDYFFLIGEYCIHSIRFASDWSKSEPLRKHCRQNLKRIKFDKSFGTFFVLFICLIGGVTAVRRQMSGFEPSRPCFCFFFPVFVFFGGGSGGFIIAAALTSLFFTRRTCFSLPNVPNAWSTFWFGRFSKLENFQKIRLSLSNQKFVISGNT